VAEQATRLGIGVKVLAGLVPGDGAVRVAVQLGALSVEGLRFLDEEDITALAGSATVATLLPATAFEQGWQPYPPARALIEAGAAVALASGFDPDASPACSLPVAISLACSQMRMSPAEAIVAATINGAHALGLADRVGSIEPGKQADLVVFDVADYREIPYHFGLNLVSMVLKRGAVLYQQGEILWEPD
jgi:imidazolonepropionase